MVLSVGVAAALVAAGVQGALRRKPVIAQRAASLLLVVTVVAMVSARFVG